MFCMLQVPLDARFERRPLGHSVFGMPIGIQLLLHKKSAIKNHFPLFEPFAIYRQAQTIGALQARLRVFIDEVNPLDDALRLPGFDFAFPNLIRALAPRDAFAWLIHQQQDNSAGLALIQINNFNVTRQELIYLEVWRRAVLPGYFQIGIRSVS